MTSETLPEKEEKEHTVILFEVLRPRCGLQSSRFWNFEWSNVIWDPKQDSLEHQNWIFGGSLSLLQLP